MHTHTHTHTHILFTGTIPARLAQLPLRTLRLHHNQLTGRLPANMLAENSQLMEVAASDNLLTGSVVKVTVRVRVGMYACICVRGQMQV